MLVNSHILKMAAMLKPNAEYNRNRDHRRPSRWALSNGNNSFFEHLRSIVYNVVAKYTLEQANEDPICQRGRVTRKNASQGPPQSLKVLISDNLRQSLHDLMDVAVDGNCGVQKVICFSAGRCTGSCKSF